jgi:hypothetical protein
MGCPRRNPSFDGNLVPCRDEQRRTFQELCNRSSERIALLTLGAAASDAMLWRASVSTTKRTLKPARAKISEGDQKQFDLRLEVASVFPRQPVEAPRLARHILTKYDPMTVRSRDNDLPHPICRVGRPQLENARSHGTTQPTYRNKFLDQSQQSVSRVRATTFVITHSPSRSNRRVLAFLGNARAVRRSRSD